MTESLRIPAAAYDDVRRTLDLSPAHISSLGNALTKSETPRHNINHVLPKVVKAMGIDARTARAAFYVATYLFDRIDQGLGVRDLLDALDSFVEEHLSEDSEEYAKKLQHLKPSLEQLLVDYESSGFIRKVKALSIGPIDSIFDFRTICDMRPVFHDVGGRTTTPSTIDGFVPVVYFVFDVEEPDGDQRTVSLQGHPNLIEVMLAELERARNKINMMERLFEMSRKDFSQEVVSTKAAKRRASDA